MSTRAKPFTSYRRWCPSHEHHSPSAPVFAGWPRDNLRHYGVGRPYSPLRSGMMGANASIWVGKTPTYDIVVRRRTSRI